MIGFIWLLLITIGCCTALYRLLFHQDPSIFAELVEAMFAMSELGFEIALGLTGLLALWMGLFEIAQRSGMADWIGRGLAPLLHRLMPEVPKQHPAMAAMTLNIGANVLGLDNAATPMGLKAMNELQRLNPVKSIASNAQIFFLVLNTSSITLIPVTIFLYRAQQGSSDPTAVFLPILFATSASTLVGAWVTGLVQRIHLLNPVVLAYLGGYAALLTTLFVTLGQSDSETTQQISSAIANITLVAVVMLMLMAGVVKRLDVYQCFIRGAKRGFGIALRIMPYLIAMLFAIGMVRASGALEHATDVIRAMVQWFGWDTQFVDALPVALMKPLSGSGSRALMLETLNHHGVDSFVGQLAAVMQGSTETTLYVLAVYFGSVGISKTRHALVCGLTADFAGIVAAIFATYLFFN